MPELSVTLEVLSSFVTCSAVFMVATIVFTRASSLSVSPQEALPSSERASSLNCAACSLATPEDTALSYNALIIVFEAFDFVASLLPHSSKIASTRVSSGDNLS